MCEDSLEASRDPASRKHEFLNTQRRVDVRREARSYGPARWGLGMASHEAVGANLRQVMESAWGGGVAPFATGSKKLGMWLFIISDAITFSALIMAYSYVRVAPTPDNVTNSC